MSDRKVALSVYYQLTTNAKHLPEDACVNLLLSSLDSSCPPFSFFMQTSKLCLFNQDTFFLIADAHSSSLPGNTSDIQQTLHITMDHSRPKLHHIGDVAEVAKQCQLMLVCARQPAYSQLWCQLSLKALMLWCGFDLLIIKCYLCCLYRLISTVRLNKKKKKISCRRRSGS